jgi:hypothetical protein
MSPGIFRYRFSALSTINERTFDQSVSSGRIKRTVSANNENPQSSNFSPKQISIPRLAETLRPHLADKFSMFRKLTDTILDEEFAALSKKA